MANLGYLQLTRNCYQRCRFCSNPPTGVDLSEAEMRGLIDDLAARGYDGVILTGGEPSLSPLLFPALAYAAERGLYSRMITNGQLLADHAFFARCVDAGLRHIHVSLHSYRPEVHDFITQYPRAWETLVTCLSHVPSLGVTADINTVINTYNADHLHETVIWITDQFPFIRHFVWNNMDPDGNRAEENPDCIPHHREFQVSLELAMEYLHATGRTFRAERVPLCYMRRFPWASPKRARSSRRKNGVSVSLTRKGLSIKRSSSTAKAAPAKFAVGIPSARACSPWPKPMMNENFHPFSKTLSPSWPKSSAETRSPPSWPASSLGAAAVPPPNNLPKRPVPRFGPFPGKSFGR